MQRNVHNRFPLIRSQPRSVGHPINPPQTNGFVTTMRIARARLHLASITG